VIFCAGCCRLTTIIPNSGRQLRDYWGLVVAKRGRCHCTVVVAVDEAAAEGTIEGAAWMMTVEVDPVGDSAESGFFRTPKSRHHFRKIFAPARRLLLSMAPPPCAIDRMPVIARRGLRAILIGHSNEKTRRGRELSEGGRP
jgi:hypothetical protein